MTRSGRRTCREALKMDEVCKHSRVQHGLVSPTMYSNDILVIHPSRTSLLSIEARVPYLAAEAVLRQSP